MTKNESRFRTGDLVVIKKNYFNGKNEFAIVVKSGVEDGFLDEHNNTIVSDPFPFVHFFLHIFTKVH